MCTIKHSLTLQYSVARWQCLFPGLCIKRTWNRQSDGQHHLVNPRICERRLNIGSPILETRFAAGLSYKLDSSWMPLFSSRPAATFRAASHHRRLANIKLLCSVIDKDIWAWCTACVLLKHCPWVPRHATLCNGHTRWQEMLPICRFRDVLRCQTVST